MVEQGLAASGDFRVVRCGWGGHLGFYSTVPRFSEVANCGDLLNVRARFDIGAGTVRVDTETEGLKPEDCQKLANFCTESVIF